MRAIIEQLYQLITDSRYNLIQEIAYYALQEAQHPDAPAVVGAGLDHPDEWVKTMSATILCRYHDPRAYPALVDILQHGKPDHRTYAASGLGYLGNPQAVEPLLATLHDNPPHVIEYTCLALGYLGEARAVPPLIKMLAHANPVLAASAATALGQLGDKRAVEPLIEALQSQRPSLDTAVARALGRIGDSRAVPILQAQIEAHPRELRMAPGAALVQLGQEGIMALLEVLQHGAPAAQAEAARALRQADSPAIIAPLVAALDHPDDKVRWMAALALSDKGVAQAIPALQRLATDPNAFVRKQALAALIATAGMDELALAALKDDDASVRQSVVRHLGGIPEARPVLLELLTTDPDPAVQHSAAASLVKIGGRPVIQALVELMGKTGGTPAIVMALLELKVVAVTTGILKFIKSTRDYRWIHTARWRADGRQLQEGLPALVAALQTEDPAVNEETLAAVLYLRNPYTLLIALRARSENVRALAIAALGLMLDPMALDGLNRALNDPEPVVRYAAVKAARRVLNPEMAFGWAV